jgi:hypothetical protein
MEKVNSVKKVTLVLRERIVYEGSVHILFIYSYEIVHFYSYIVHSDTSFLMLIVLQTCAEQ